MPGKSEPEAPEAEDNITAEAAEAAAAAAEARAGAARARANELRRKLEASRDETPVPADTAAVAVANEDEPDDSESAGTEPAQPAEDAALEGKRQLRLPRLESVAATLLVLVIAGLLSATGYMLWEHRNAELQRHRTAEFAAAARQGVVNLMSLDYTHAKESVQRVIDDSAGKFKSNFEDGSGDLIKALQEAKVITKVTVNNSAVESMDNDSATVLVAATSQRTGPDAPKEDQQPRVWRVVVSLVREGDQLKMSDIEFA